MAARSVVTGTPSRSLSVEKGMRLEWEQIIQVDMTWIGNEAHDMCQSIPAELRQSIAEKGYDDQHTWEKFDPEGCANEKEQGSSASARWT